MVLHGGVALTYGAVQGGEVMDLVMGGNAPIPPVDLLQVSCSWSTRTGLDADLSMLQLTGGQVRGDSDFVFYNQPTSTDGALQLTGKHSRDGTTVDGLSAQLGRVDPQVDSIVVLVSMDGPPGSSLADLGDLLGTVWFGAADPDEARFQVTGLTTETAVVIFELYRRGNGWKLRAVGQGYQDGLAGLARDFGVHVDDEPAPADSSTPTTPAVDWRNPPVPAGYEI